MATPAVLYLLNSTDDDPDRRIVITPRAYDGPGGVQRTTDLTFYGNGAPNWGERFNENFYHLLENFAVSEQGGSDGVPNLAQPPAPKTETDLGGEIGLGVNNPIEGQLWYNKSRGLMYIYTGVQYDGGVGTPTWKPTSNVLTVTDAAERNSYFSGVPGVARNGDFVYNQATSSLEIFYNGAWSSTSNFVRLDGANTPMTGFLTLNADPTALMHAATKQYVDAAISGGTGSLNLNALTDVTIAGPSTGQYLRKSGGDWLNSSLLWSDMQTANGISATTSQLNFLVGVSSNIQTQLNNKVTKTGDTMTGNLTMSGAGVQVVLPNLPTVGTHAANKTYVDSMAAAAGIIASLGTGVYGIANGQGGWMDIPVTVGGTPRTLIVQWGCGNKVDFDGANWPAYGTVTFPKAFTNAVLQIIGGAHGLANYTRQSYQYCVRDETVTLSGFSWTTGEDDGKVQNAGITYIAIGW